MKYGMDQDRTNDNRPNGLLCDDSCFKFYSPNGPDPLRPGHVVKDLKDNKDLSIWWRG